MVQSEFGAFLSRQRKEKGFTQKQLADLLFVSDKAISRWECGNGFPDINQLQPLSEVLGVSLVELLNAERMDDSACIAVANDAIKSAFSFSEQALADVRTKMRFRVLFAFVGVVVLLNCHFGGVFDWLLGYLFSYERPFMILYYIRHLIAAIALGLIGILCLFPRQNKLVRFVLAGCLCSVATTLIAIIIWRITYGFDLMIRIDYVSLILFTVSTILLIIATVRKKLTEEISLQVILYVSSFCVFCPVLFSLGLQNHTPVIESILRSIALASPMLILAVFLRIQASTQTRKPCE